jgi:Cdc6-like AAA superfamily ATPase
VNEKGKPGKPHNALLYGLYGTGKSQLLMHLLSTREFTLPNGKNIHLNANVININVSEFAELIVKSASGFRKRLSDLHENTGLPIILVIEDLDTLIQEDGIKSDPISQALTTCFE